MHYTGNIHFFKYECVFLCIYLCGLDILVMSDDKMLQILQIFFKFNTV